MTSNATKHLVLSLYRDLLKESKRFSEYNFRMYALRRTHDAFKEHKDEKDPEKIEEFIKLAQENLSMIKRQVVVGQLYSHGRLIIENESDKPK